MLSGYKNWFMKMVIEYFFLLKLKSIKENDDYGGHDDVTFLRNIRRNNRVLR